MEPAHRRGGDGASPTLADFEEVVGRRYGDDPAFVHPDIGFLSRVLAGRSAYLTRGRARPFVWRDDHGRAVAFCTGFVDPGLQEKTGSATGSIGFFEALDDDVARRVLDDACEWLATQGVTEVWAPFNANPYNRMGAREDRFGEPPFIGCAHDPPSTRDYLGAAGFEQINRYLNFAIDLDRRPWEGVVPAPGVTLRPASRRRFRDEVLEYVHLHNLAFRTVWGEVEISDGEALQMLMRSRLAIEPRLFQFAQVEDETVGFVLCMPDLNAGLAPLRVPLTSAQGILKITRARRRVRTAGLLSLAVAPGHQGRGIGATLVAAACRAAADMGLSGFEYALVADNNEPSKALARRFGGTVCRTFGIYRRTIT